MDSKAQGKRSSTQLMLLKILVVIVFTRIASSMAQLDQGFVFNRFVADNITLHGDGEIKDGGLLRLTDASTQNQIGYGFYGRPFSFKFGDGKNSTLSFSTIFVIEIESELSPDRNLSGNGMAFVISPSKELVRANPGPYLGFLNSTVDGNYDNHIVGIEFDTIQNIELDDIDDNHVAIDINSIISINSSTAAYYDNTANKTMNVSLCCGSPIMVWVDYDGVDKLLHVTIAPTGVPKPIFPLLSQNIDLSAVLLDQMYVGFSAATNAILTCHYVLGWSFQMNGQAQALDPNQLPKPPSSQSASSNTPPSPPPKTSKLELILMALAVIVVFMLIAVGVILWVRKIKYGELLEDWEIEYGPHRFSYKELYKATNGFKEKNLLGKGGFGKVYKGVMPKTGAAVAIKKISHDSEQGMKEFVAEIASIGRIRHPNLVRLQGYSRRKKELILVYDCMENGSLDRFLYDNPKSTLSWSQRFLVIKQVANGLHYLHDGWNQVVIHRDIKASNVLLDGEQNAKLGDFGLSTLYDHGTNPETTRLVGTIGYIAPEINRTGRVSTSSDVYAFGKFMLEVACGRRPMERNPCPNRICIVDWVVECLSNGRILDSADKNMGGEFVEEEVELALKLGLCCAHHVHDARPTMRQVMQFLKKEKPLPELLVEEIKAFASTPIRERGEGSHDESVSILSIESATILHVGR